MVLAMSLIVGSGLPIVSAENSLRGWFLAIFLKQSILTEHIGQGWQEMPGAGTACYLKQIPLPRIGSDQRISGGKLKVI